MTRYRARTHRAIIHFLQQEGPSSIYDISTAIGKEVRVTRNYLNHFRSDFEVIGHARGAKWMTSVEELQRGYDLSHKTR